MIKKMIIAGLITGSALYANIPNVNHHNHSNTNKITKNNGYLSKSEVISLLKGIPNANKIISDYKKGKIKIYAKKIDNFYAIMLKDNKNSITLFLTKNKKFLIEGAVFDLKNKKLLGIHPPVDKKIVKSGIEITFGKGKKVLYMIIDPECPYCKILESNKGFMNYLAKNYKVNIIIYPLAFHQNSVKMTEYILSAKTNKERLNRLRRVFKGSKEYTYMHLTTKEKNKIDEEIEKGKKASMELNFKGTPSFFDEKFDSVNPIGLYKKAQKENKK